MRAHRPVRRLFARCCSPAASRARDEIEVRDARLRAAEDGLVLDADFAFELTPRLAEVVVERRAAVLPRRLRADAPPLVLVRRERRVRAACSCACPIMRCRGTIGCPPGCCSRLSPRCEEALNVLKRVRNWLVVDRTVTFADARLRSGGAHAPRHRAAAEAVPAQRAHQPRAAPRVAMEALHRAFAAAAAGAGREPRAAAGAER